MFETPLTVVGNIVSDPIRRRVGDQEVIKFRVASNSRRRTAEGAWEPGNSLFVTVSCWGRLVTGIGAALGKGDPVVAVGYVYTSEYEDREGVRRSTLEMRATTVGPDLARSIARVDRPRYLGGNAERPAGAEEASDSVTETAPGGSVDGDGGAAESESAIDGSALPLSA